MIYLFFCHVKFKCNLNFAQRMAKRGLLTNLFSRWSSSFPTFSSFFTSSCSYSGFSFISVSFFPLYLLLLLSTFYFSLFYLHYDSYLIALDFDHQAKLVVSVEQDLKYQKLLKYQELFILNKFLLMASQTSCFPEVPSIPMAAPSKFSLFLLLPTSPQPWSY